MKLKLSIPIIALCIIGVLLASGCVSQQPPPVTPTPTMTPTITATPTSAPKLYSQAEVDAKLQWRKLWEDHILWTRMVIINIADSPGGMNESVQRLLDNYESMESALKPYYGNETAEKFGDLVKEHILIAAELVTAAKAGNSTAAAAAEKKWYENADEIATTLSAINPNWDKQAGMAMWHEHLATTKDEAVARITKNYTADVAAFDIVQAQALKMADMISDGLIKQFPGKFSGPKVYSQGEMNLKNALRVLWTDHAVWTRMYIIAALNDAPETSAAATRLLKNQEDIGNAIKPLYGDAAGTALTTRLKDHILIAVDIVTAVKMKNSTVQAAAEKRWAENADDIAAFLASANSNWPLQTLKDLMRMHLSTTKDELVARATKNYTADVKAYDAVYTHIMTMSDALTEGIIKQFQAKF